MTLPYREWTSLIIRTITYNSIDNSNNDINDWTTEHIETGIVGLGNDGVDPKYWGWHVLLLGSDGFQLESSADEIVDVGIDIELSLLENSAGVGRFTLFNYVFNKPSSPDAWSPESVNGKYYDGVNQWPSYPPVGGSVQFHSKTLNVADLPFSGTIWTPAYIAGPKSNEHQEDIFRVGFSHYLSNYDVSTPFPDNKYFKCSFDATKIKVHFLNAIVNSLSRRTFSGDGGEELVLTGLAFDQDDDELNDNSRNPYNNQFFNWHSLVDEIVFEGQSGQGNYTLKRTDGDFTVDSDTQITIPSMPPMADGTYKIKLIKKQVNEVGDVISYAGEFQAASDGKMTKPDWGPYADVLTIAVGMPPEEKHPIVTWEWGWKIAGELQYEYYAPIDVRGPDYFWEGRVLSVSSLTRSIDDFTGLFQVSDMSVELASNDQHFQRLLAQGHCKNQPVSIAFGWSNEPASWFTNIFKGICDDYTLVGTTFSAQLKDITQKYFRKRLPRYIATEDEYPNIHPDHIGRPIPEILGEHSWTQGENPGAIEAIYIDTTSYQYVAAAGPLYSITQVYSNGVLVNPANYSVTIGADGRTYITFTSDQGDNKITFNCTGYYLTGWNSSNGYIQNPAYILAFVLVYLLDAPLTDIDSTALSTLATYYNDNGWAEIGRLAITEDQEASSIFQDLLFSFGVKMWPSLEGKFKFARKDITNFETDFTIFAQIELMEEPDRQYNLRDAINQIKIKWDYYPAPQTWKGADTIERETSKDFYEVTMEPASEWNYPWITSSDFASQRANEDLDRLAYGYQAISFTLPIEFINVLDIFDNFKLQDPYDVSATGSGNPGHYYYVTSLTYDFQNMTIQVEAADLSWLAAQCMIIANCDDVVNNYADASPWMRMFAYIGDCSTDRLPGGDPLKKICKCD